MQSTPFDLVALVGSAGAHMAILRILQDLPPSFAYSIVVMQHLGPDSTGTVPMYARRVRYPVGWVQPDSILIPGRILVCPARTFVELRPGGGFALSANARGALARPMDRLLGSVAHCFGQRALGVVLTGLGDDGALGAQALQLSGGQVLVQSESTADFPEMPRAAIRAGAADLVVPLVDLGQMIGEIAAGTPRTRMRSEIAAVGAMFSGAGEARAQLREVDWSATPLGPVAAWPESLRAVVRAALASRLPTAVCWGPELVHIANDGFLPAFGDARVQGLPAREVWAGLRDGLAATFYEVVRSGEATRVEEAFATFSHSPLYDESGAVAGVLSIRTEAIERPRRSASRA